MTKLIDFQIDSVVYVHEEDEVPTSVEYHVEQLEDGRARLQFKVIEFHKTGTGTYDGKVVHEEDKVFPSVDDVLAYLNDA